MQLNIGLFFVFHFLFIFRSRNAKKVFGLAGHGQQLSHPHHLPSLLICHLQTGVLNVLWLTSHIIELNTIWRHMYCINQCLSTDWSQTQIYWRATF
jgi:hypothetical protein